MNIDYKTFISKYNGDIIDIRDSYSFNKGHIPGSINLNINSILYNVNKLSKDKIYLLVCDTSKTSLKLSKILNSLGFNTYSLEGGYSKYVLVN